MMNRILLLREAKRYRIEAATEDDVMREFIDLKIRAFIRVSEGISSSSIRIISRNFPEEILKAYAKRSSDT